MSAWTARLLAPGTGGDDDGPRPDQRAADPHADDPIPLLGEPLDPLAQAQRPALAA